MNMPEHSQAVRSEDLNEIIDRFEETGPPSGISKGLSAQTSCNKLHVGFLRISASRSGAASGRRRTTWYRRLSLQVSPDWCFRQLNWANFAFEEYRLRHHFEQPVRREDFSGRLGVDVSLWPTWKVGSPDSQAGSADSMSSTTRYPELGELFHGYELVGLLGTGSFRHVFLARQGDLANRFVAVKVTEVNVNEPQILARLQHTNIVPIHSLNRDDRLQSICMPSWG